jgi:hypothetical protein
MSAPTTMQIPGFRGDVIAPDHHDYDDAEPYGTAPSTDDLG